MQALFGTRTWDGFADDFTSLPELAAIVQFTIRLLVAACLGAVIGWQREHHRKAAGLRTHMLVAIGAATFVGVPSEMAWLSADLSRVIQGIVAGIGFLGAGTILKSADEKHVQGLTTAADIWMTAAIGVAVGLGRLFFAGIAAAMAFGILTVVVYLEPRIRGTEDSKQELHRSKKVSEGQDEQGEQNRT